MIVRVEAITDRSTADLGPDERQRLQAAVDAALPGRKVHVVVAKTSNRDLDFGALANLLTEVRKESGSLEDALRVVVRAARRGHCHTRAAELNSIIAAVAKRHGIAPQTIVGISRRPAAARARTEVWWLARQRGVTDEALGAAFDRDRSTVSEALRRFEDTLARDAELRAGMAWAADEWRRGAA